MDATLPQARAHGFFYAQSKRKIWSLAMSSITTPSLNEVRKVVCTADAAKALNRTTQTLRKWACFENGPIRPIRINGRLAWPVDEIAALLNGGSK